jgi:spermidine synthase
MRLARILERGRRSLDAPQDGGARAGSGALTLDDSSHTNVRRLALIALIAGSMLVHEILLTRVCALRLHFHFAYLVISNCLLGMGAGGGVLALHSERFRRDPDVWLGRFTLAYAATLAATFLALSYSPLPRDLTLSHASHALSLLLFNLAGAVPFFFGGIAIGCLLTLEPARANKLYAADLAGAGLGCLLCPALLRFTGAGGAFMAVVTLALVSSALAYGNVLGSHQRRALFAACAICLLALPFFDGLFPIPSKGIALTELVPGSPERPIRRMWTSNSRIDVELAPEQLPAFIFMRGTTPSRIPAPERWAHIAQDASAGTAIIDFSREPQGLTLLQESMYSTAYRLRSKPNVLVIGLGGGNDVWAARIHGAKSVRAIELNEPVVDTHLYVLRRYSRAIVEDPTIQFTIGEGRSELMRDSRRYDVIQMSGIDTWTALASGAYVLAENYLYTREAIAQMYDHLEPSGILQIARYSAEMEALRLMSNISAALADSGVPAIERSVMAMATPDKMLAVLVKRGEFSDTEQASTREFAERNGIELVYVPNRPVQTRVDEFVRSPNKARLIDAFPQNIEPTDDDRPYFFNFTKWQHPLRSIETLGEIPAVSQGNPLFLLTQLAMSFALSTVFIVWPLVRRRRAARMLSGGTTARFLVYFAALGAGFMLIEIAIMQKLTLFLGEPIFSLTVTLFSLLVFTGLGSLLFAERVRGARVWLVPLGLVVYVVVFLTLGSPLLYAAIGLPVTARVAIAVMLLAPLGLLLGVPFAYGLRVASERDPWLGPWAWAINGCASVVGSIITVVLSMNFGFTFVLWAAVVVYVLGFIALPNRGPASEPASLLR